MQSVGHCWEKEAIAAANRVELSVWCCNYNRVQTTDKFSSVRTMAFVCKPELHVEFLPMQQAMAQLSTEAD